MKPFSAKRPTSVEKPISLKNETKNTESPSAKGGETYEAQSNHS